MKNLIIVALGLSLFVSSCKIADFSNETARQDSSAEARAILIAAAQAHGVDNWKNVSTYEVSFKDEFYGTFGKMASNFKGNPAVFRLQYAPKAMDARMTFLHDKMKDEVWTLDSGGQFTGSKHAVFWLPTYQYFIEFPARILEADVFRVLGEEELNGQLHQKVFATWGKVEAQEEYDQYLIWVNKETKLIGKVAYTIREAGKWLTGYALFNGLKDFGGIIIPTDMPVGSNLLKEGKLLHRMSIQELRFDSFDAAELR